MRTSNKILLGFIIFCFLIPLSLLLSFKNKINKGRYTVETQHGQGSNFRSGQFKPYKVVKFVSPEGGWLRATLQQSDSLYYSYHMMNQQDSIKVYNAADTLFVEFISFAKGEPGYRTDLHLRLKLPSCEHLIIDNAEVVLDSTAVFKNELTAEINRAGVLKIGTMREQSPGWDEPETREFPYSLGRVSVQMNEGEFLLGSKTTVQQLDIKTSGRSAVTINDGAVIDELSGNLSEQSSVKANWKYVKRLAAPAGEENKKQLTQP